MARKIGRPLLPHTLRPLQDRTATWKGITRWYMLNGRLIHGRELHAGVMWEYEGSSEFGKNGLEMEFGSNGSARRYRRERW